MKCFEGIQFLSNSFFEKSDSTFVISIKGGHNVFTEAQKEIWDLAECFLTKKVYKGWNKDEI